MGLGYQTRRQKEPRSIGSTKENAYDPIRMDFNSRNPNDVLNFFVVKEQVFTILTNYSLRFFFCFIIHLRS
jgi:hypothetical protein